MYTVGGEEYSDLQLIDILSYSSYPTHISRNATLVLSSVKLYYAETNEDGSGKVDSDGNLINSGIELDDINEYTWSYDEDISHHVYPDRTQDDVIKYIHLTIPNGVPLIFEYQYAITVVKAENTDWTDCGANVTNKASISINGQEIAVTPGKTTTDTVEDSGTSGSADAGAGYTIYKMDKDNFALTLSDATFDLYVFDAEETGGFKYVGSYTTSSNGSTGIKGAPYSNDEGEIVHYEIALSDNTTYNVPINTICYFVESKAPDGYKLDTTKHYFYFGKSSATASSVCDGYDVSELSTDSKLIANNIIISHTEYISNEHSMEYYAEKTNLAVVKKWVDASGNDITASKSDGSIEFELWRVFTPVDDNGGTGGDSGGDGKVTLNWSAVDGNSISVDSGSITCEPNTKAKVTINIPRAYEDWYPGVKITDSDTGETLALFYDTYDYSDKAEPETGETWDLDNKTFTAEIDVGDKGRNIEIKVTEYVYNTINVTVTGSGDSEETTGIITEGPNETTTAEATGTALHEHNFSDLENNILSEDKKTSTITDNYFTIIGNLSDDHGEATYKINDVITTLTRCLKMESKTNISFTANEPGLLRLVFNTAGSGSELITNNCKIDGATYAATNNVLVMELGAGEHTITKQDTCYIFYMSFEEGAGFEDSNMFDHSFNDGMNSLFYEISTSGSTATNKGTVTYNGVDITTCYKMNSKASITFDAPKEGTINLVLTNPNKAAVVGVKIDGADHYATATGEYDSNGNEIYLLTARVSEGEHTIKRINSTEVMLYYIDYIPDDYGNEDLSDIIPSNPNAIRYPDVETTYSISAQSSWARAFTNLPWQVIDEETGETKGYYSYYVVEVDNGSYITQYKNNVAEGIFSGTIGIYNQDKDNSTALTVIKRWLDIEGRDDSANHSEDEITFNLYGAINLNEGKTLNTTKTEAHSFTTYNSNFYTITTNYGDDGVIHGPYIVNSYGTAKYNDKTYTSCLKMESQSSIKFTAPANGTLTLVFSNTFPEGYGGLGFKLTYDGATTAYAYDASTDTTTGNCTVTYSDDAVIFNVTLEEAGDYEITTNKQCYLFYMDYVYKLSDAEDGVLIGSYTINADDGSEGWTKSISGLPLYIHDDNNNVIGEYSYYVVETSPSSGYITTVEYSQSGDPQEDLVIQKDTITAGTITITNKENITDIVLPETGGEGTNKYMLAGLLLSLTAGLLLYKHKRQRKFRV